MRECELQNYVEADSKMSEPFERLKKARIAAGYKTAAEAARALGVKLETYHKHESGMNGLKNAALHYAKAFKVSLDWLLRGEGSPELNVAAPTTTAAWLDVEKLESALTATLHVMAGLPEGEAARFAQELIQIVRMPQDSSNKLDELSQARFRAETLSQLYASRARTAKSKGRNY